ncbi:DUF4331 domain-containing protein [Roseibacillus persicicus]|uniref:DUF4331 domain-containing protein n=1 Tax=Roseibacillus persicicus TaxID=454148 RepID=A0A918TI07_9BACT|nr:DUF4331 domain-containing protein [Roseibacillus persicicus]GHC47095.1 hypothetical protein GCM10007100_11050 [Roseibacillus persicicus]
MKYRSTAVASAALILSSGVTFASSHSDAPLIKQDPQANLTDVYAFVGTKYDDPNQNVLNVLVSVRPFSEPGDGVIYERFADDAQYSIHITNPVTGSVIDSYDFEFSDVTAVKNPNTILSYGLGTAAGLIEMIGDSQQNFTQTYTVRKNGIVIGSDLPVPPPNAGARTTPGYNDANGFAISGAADFASLDPLTAQGISPLPSGVVAWAGPREDGFYADTPGIFDFLNPRILDNDDDLEDGFGQDGNGIDGFKGFNVLTYALQIPINTLPASGFSNPLLGAQTGVGVYASVSRQRYTLRSTGRKPRGSGPWIQVNRLGNPLFNEVLVHNKDKDNYNLKSPSGDAAFSTYAENSHLAFLINVVVFGDAEGDGPLPTTGRADLAAIFIPDVVRVDTTTGPVPLPGQEGFNRLSVVGGDAAGWPNGRRIGDDVVDIALSAIASGPTFETITLVGDNVANNDQAYNTVFPYLGTPHAGTTVSQRQAALSSPPPARSAAAPEDEASSTEPAPAATPERSPAKQNARTKRATRSR